MNKEFFFHIGYQKTGTSTLQQTVFPFIEGLHFCGQPYREDGQGWRDFIVEISQTDSLFYDKHKIDDIFDGLCQRIEKTKILLSNENVIDPRESSDMGVVIDRIASLNTRPKIILTIRNQLEIIPSLYMEVFSEVASRSHYINWLERHLSEHNDCYITKHNYYKLIKRLEMAFGKENICLLMLEEMVSDRDFFYRTLGGFMGVDIEYGREDARINPRTHGRSYTLTETRNKLAYVKRLMPAALHVPMKRLYGDAPDRIMKFVQKNLGRLSPSVDVSLPPDIERELCDLFRDGNRNLQQEYKSDLGQYGYPV